MYDLAKLTLQNITEIGIALRGFGKDADSLEAVANRCVRYFYNNLIDPTTGQSACVLARFFKTHPYAALPASLQNYARELVTSSEDLPADLKCLSLFATQGEYPQWCDRHTSNGHQVIPLTSKSGVSQIPMISQLIKSFGLDINDVIAPDPKLLIAIEQKTCNVFYIPIATGSQHIPAQDEFVKPYSVKSVLGFGGMLPSGNLFAVILFSKVAIPEDTARLFKTLPLSIKMAIIPFETKDPFQSQSADSLQTA